MTNEIKIDKDVPYAGDAICNLTLGEIGATIDLSVSRTLAKGTLRARS